LGGIKAEAGKGSSSGLWATHHSRRIFSSDGAFPWGDGDATADEKTREGEKKKSTRVEAGAGLRPFRHKRVKKGTADFVRAGKWKSKGGGGKISVGGTKKLGSSASVGREGGKPAPQKK